MPKQKEACRTYTRFPGINNMKISIRTVKRTEPAGVIYHCCVSEPIPFFGFGGLLLEIDRLCDVLGFPKAEPKRRRLHRISEETKPPEFYHLFKEFGAQKNEIYSMILTLRYRQNASWQGSVCFAGDSRIYVFRSALEFVGYMAEKLEEIERNPRGGRKD